MYLIYGVCVIVSLCVVALVADIVRNERLHDDFYKKYGYHI